MSRESLHIYRRRWPSNLTTLYLHFVQLATTAAGGASDAAAFVLPLAIGANRSTDHRRVRSAIQRTNGKWAFLFFDRQPHAHLGEDAKTRATILLKKPSNIPEVETSSLLKWTSKQRPAIFSAGRALAFAGPIGPFAPKLGSAAELEIYEAHEALHSPLRHHVEISKAAATEIVGKSLSDDVFVAGPAYNFLNVSTCTILRQLGFIMINEVIWSKDGTGGRWGSANGQRPIFGSYPYPPNFLFKTVHEYILVFQKPKQAKSKGTKVRLYDELMTPSLQYREAAE